MSESLPGDEDRAANPYQAQASAPARYAEGQIRLPENQTPGLVGHLRVLGVLMIVQGVLLSLLAIMIAIYAVMMPQAFAEMQRDAAAGGGNAPLPPNMPEWIWGIATVIAVVMGLLAVVTIYSGSRVFRYRGHTLAIVALCSGMLSIFTCYCFPTALALGIYGLIVLLNGPVQIAFDLSEQGYDPREIRQAFSSLPRSP